MQQALVREAVKAAQVTHLETCTKVHMHMLVLVKDMSCKRRFAGCDVVVSKALSGTPIWPHQDHGLGALARAQRAGRRAMAEAVRPRPHSAPCIRSHSNGF